MQLRRSCLFLWVAASTWISVELRSAEPSSPFELRDGDRVVFLGNSFFERALDYGHLETALALRWPDRRVTFRNLGWDGDTVYGHSRAGGRRRSVFGDAEEGFQKMIQHVNTEKPTVMFLAYGYNESFDGEAGVARFRKGLQRLLTEIGTEETRWVLITPQATEAQLGLVNEMLGRYAETVLEVAAADGHYAVDLFRDPSLQSPISYENGLHLSDAGYRKAAALLAGQLKLPSPRIDLDSPDAEELRRAIVKKNTLYFHRWRPRNDAFVYGERKDEQKIAQKEPAKFEPFIAKQEQVIRQLLKP